MADQIVSIGDQRPEVYQIETIYDPDIHGSDINAVTISGLYVPKVGAIVVDADDRMRRVAAVDPITYKVTYGKFSLAAEGSEGNLINYGNEIYIVYYDNDINPNKLIVDQKVVLFDSTAAFYKIYKEVNDVQTSIGIYIDSHGVVQSDSIPMVESGVTGIKSCANCFTNIDLHPGEFLTIHIYDADGEPLSTIKLISCKSTIISELPTITNPIVDFVIESSQERGGEMILYKNQDPMEVGIYPTIVYADGATQRVTIDGQSCIMYGLEEIIPPYIGSRFQIICKYWPSVLNNVTDGLIGAGVKHITATKWVVIDDREEHAVNKISFLPEWNVLATSWTMRARAYKIDRADPEDVTNQITWITGINGGLFNTPQAYELEIRNAEIVAYTQTGSVTLNNISQSPNWLIDGYGGESPTLPRPHVIYNEGVYSIPVDRFTTMAVFLEAFYTSSAPPYNVEEGETSAPDPTHFVVRTIDTGRMIIPTPIEVANYGNALTIIEDVTGSFEDTSVIFEFLVYVGSEYTTIYGVPVEVR